MKKNTLKMFRGKVVLVTGAASGMGRALALTLCDLGATVIATDLNEALLQAVARDATGLEGAVTCRYLDVTDKQAFEALIEDVAKTHGRLDYLFNNAGIAIAGEVRDMDFADWQRTIEINQMGVLHGTLAAYRVMIEQGSGHIVNTASVAGLVPTPLLTAYSMTKHAVVGLSLALREEAQGLGVQVSVVCPGLVRTNIVKPETMRQLDMSSDPFDFMQQKTRIRPISAEQAADFILKGVARNEAQVVFPHHGRMLVNFYRHARKAWEAFNRLGLKQIRSRHRG